MSIEARAEVVDDLLCGARQKVVLVVVGGPTHAARHGQYDGGGREQLVGRLPEEGEGCRCDPARWLVEEDLVEDDLERPRLDHTRDGVDDAEGAPGDELATLCRDVGNERRQDRPARPQDDLVVAAWVARLGLTMKTKARHLADTGSFADVVSTWSARLALLRHVNDCNANARAREPSCAARARSSTSSTTASVSASAFPGSTSTARSPSPSSVRICPRSEATAQMPAAMYSTTFRGEK